MAWDSDKSTNGELDADEWDAHVTHQKGPTLTQRGDPTTSDLADGECRIYNSDGTGTGSAGDLVYAVNDSGTIKTSIIQQRSNAT